MLDLGNIMPINVIGMLLGIPESGSAGRPRAQGPRHAAVAREPREYDNHNFADEAFFADYIAWRADHPSDDLMTDLLRVEFEDLG